MSGLVRCVFDVHVKPSKFQQAGNELNTRLARQLCASYSLLEVSPSLFSGD